MADPFEILTFDDIENDLITRIQKNQGSVVGRPILSDFSSGSVIRTITRAIAGVLADYWIGLRQLVDGFYVSSATGTTLDRRLADFGFSRFVGSRASGPGVAVRPPGVSYSGPIAAGDVLFDQGGRRYVVQASTPGFGPPSSQQVVRSLLLQAASNGDESNVTANTQLASSDTRYTGLTFVVGSGLDGLGKGTGLGLSGGMADETEAAARARFRLYLRTLGRGTKDAIEQAVRNVAGVVAATVHDRQILTTAYAPDETPVIRRSGTPGLQAKDLAGTLLVDDANNPIYNTSYDGHIVVYVQPKAGQDTSALRELVKRAIEANKAAGIAFETQYPAPRYLNVLVESQGDPSSQAAAIEIDVRAAFDKLTFGQAIDGAALAAQLYAKYGLNFVITFYESRTPPWQTADRSTKVTGSFNTIQPVTYEGVDQLLLANLVLVRTAS